MLERAHGRSTTQATSEAQPVWIPRLSTLAWVVAAGLLWVLGAVAVALSSPHPLHTRQKARGPAHATFEEGLANSPREEVTPPFGETAPRAVPVVETGPRETLEARLGVHASEAELGAKRRPETERAVVLVRVEDKRYLRPVGAARR
jgi:hypothetical protein